MEGLCVSFVLNGTVVYHFIMYYMHVHFFNVTICVQNDAMFIFLLCVTCFLTDAS